ncbi:MAG: DHH family phosphoesterase, partial [Solobacterium sp.]|nr:DHH family phosphoesterase [Solobacterium sp.]
MQKKISDLRRLLIVVVAVEAVLLFVLRAGLDKGILSATIILILQGIIFIYLIDRIDTMSREAATGVAEVLGDSAKEAFLYGEVGMIMYDDDYVITWMSELFEARDINRIGSKVLSWLPEVDPLISGGSDEVMVQLDDRV